MAHAFATYPYVTFCSMECASTQVEQKVECSCACCSTHTREKADTISSTVATALPSTISFFNTTTATTSTPTTKQAPHLPDEMILKIYQHTLDDYHFWKTFRQVNRQFYRCAESPADHQKFYDWEDPEDHKDCDMCWKQKYKDVIKTLGNRINMPAECCEVVNLDELDEKIKSVQLWDE